MATKEQMDSVERIMRLSMQISIQGKYHVFAGYSGHIDKLDVYAYHSDNDYQGREGKHVAGLESMENWITVSSGTDQLFSAEQKLLALLDRDEDGIPV